MLKWPDVLSFARDGNPAPDTKVTKTEAEWRRQLSPEEYRVTRQAATERAFSSEMCSLFEPGIYSCKCCETILFDASEKFESGTGWPSFTQPLTPNAIAYHFDGPAFLKRVETVCNTCDALFGSRFPRWPRLRERLALLHECGGPQEGVQSLLTTFRAWTKSLRSHAAIINSRVLASPRGEAVRSGLLPRTARTSWSLNDRTGSRIYAATRHSMLPLADESQLR